MVLAGIQSSVHVPKLFVEGQCCDAKFHHPVSCTLVLISSLFILFREGFSILFSMIDCKDVVLFKIVMETTPPSTWSGYQAELQGIYLQFEAEPQLISSPEQNSQLISIQCAETPSGMGQEDGCRTRRGQGL